MTNEELKKHAANAVQELMSDQSVSLEVAIDNLEELSADIDGYIMALKEDLKRESA